MKSYLGMIWIVLLLSYSSVSFAEPQLSVNLDPKSGDTNTLFRLEIAVSVHGSEEVGVPQFGSSTDFVIESRGKRQSMTIVNGDPSQSISFIYQVTARRQLAPGNYSLPRGQVEIDGKYVPIDPQTIRLEAAPKTSRKGPLDFAQVVDNLAPYEGEQLTYRSELVSSAEISDAVLEETTLPSFFREDFPEHKQVVRRVSNSRVFSVREAIYPNQSGEVEIPERALSAKVKVQAESRDKWGGLFDDIWTDVFDEFNYKPIRITAPAIKLNVRPLPPKPAGITGYTPVGPTTIRSHLDKAELRAGESGTLEILVESEGNLKPLEFDFNKMLPKNLRVYPEKAESETILSGEKVIQRKHFQAAIVPEFGGQYDLGAPTVSYFDPKSESYQQAQGEKLHLIVSGPAPSKTSEPVAEASSEKQQPVEEPVKETEVPLPNKMFLMIGISRRWFSILFAVFLISILLRAWSNTPQSSAPTKRDFKKIIGDLKSNDWALTNSLRKELSVSRPTDFEKIITQIDRVNFTVPELRAKAVEELEEYLKELK